MTIYLLDKLFSTFLIYLIENRNQMCMLYTEMASFSFLINLLYFKMNFTNKYLSSPFILNQFFVKLSTKISNHCKN